MTLFTILFNCSGLNDLPNTFFPYNLSAISHDSIGPGGKPKQDKYR